MSALKPSSSLGRSKESEPALNPHDIAAEEAILGGLLLDPNAIGRIEDILRAEDFYLVGHQKIYTACLSIHRTGREIDMIGLASELKDKGLLKGVGGQAKIAGLVGGVISAVNIDQHAALVLSKSRRRSLISAGHEIVRLGHNTAEPLPAVMDAAESKIFAITQSVHAKAPRSSADVLPELFSDIEQAHEADKLPGLVCGFYDLDSMTQGFQRGDLIIAAARPAMGKTALLTQIARNIARATRLPSLIFSLEMSEKQLLKRLLAAESRIDALRLRSGRIAEKEWEPLSKAIDTLSQDPLLIHDQPMIDVGEIRSQARHIKAKHGALGCLVIDYLQLMGGGDDNRVQELSKITRSLKGLARELDAPIFALSQLNRSVESRTNKRPLMSDLRESGALEQDADLIMMLYREEYYDPGTPDRGIAEVIITKHRNGPTGTIKLLFDAPYVQFLNRAGGYGL